MEDVAEEVGVTRKTVYNRLNMELELDLENHYIDTYTALEGYRDGVIDIDPIVTNGRLTHLGKKVLHKLRADEAVQTFGISDDDDDDDDTGDSGGASDDHGDGTGPDESEDSPRAEDVEETAEDDEQESSIDFDE